MSKIRKIVITCLVLCFTGIDVKAGTASTADAETEIATSAQQNQSIQELSDHDKLSNDLKTFATLVTTATNYFSTGVIPDRYEKGDAKQLLDAIKSAYGSVFPLIEERILAYEQQADEMEKVRNRTQRTDGSSKILFRDWMLGALERLEKESFKQRPKGAHDYLARPLSIVLMGSEDTEGLRKKLASRLHTELIKEEPIKDDGKHLNQTRSLTCKYQKESEKYELQIKSIRISDLGIYMATPCLFVVCQDMQKDVNDAEDFIKTIKSIINAPTSKEQRELMIDVSFLQKDDIESEAISVRFTGSVASVFGE